MAYIHTLEYRTYKIEIGSDADHLEHRGYSLYQWIDLNNGSWTELTDMYRTKRCSGTQNLELEVIHVGDSVNLRREPVDSETRVFNPHAVSDWHSGDDSEAAVTGRSHCGMCQTTPPHVGRLQKQNCHYRDSVHLNATAFESDLVKVRGDALAPPFWIVVRSGSMWLAPYWAHKVE